MLGVDMDELETRLRPVAAASMVNEEPGGFWTFRHDLIRETQYELSRGGRANLHRAAAASLQAEDLVLPVVAEEERAI